MRAKGEARLSAKTLEACYDVLRRKTKANKGSEIFMRVFPDRPICVKVCLYYTLSGREGEGGREGREGGERADLSASFRLSIRLVVRSCRETRRVWERERDPSSTGLASESISAYRNEASLKGRERSPFSFRFSDSEAHLPSLLCLFFSLQ